METKPLLEAKSTFCHPGNERFVLSCLFADPGKFYDVASELFDGQGFLDPVHRNIYLILHSLVEKNVKNIDVITVYNVSQEVGFDVSSLDYLHSIANTFVTSSELPYYLTKIKEAFLKYRTYLTLLEAAEVVKKNNKTGEGFKTSDDLLSQVTEDIISVSLSASLANEPIDMSTYAVEYIQSIAERKSDVLGLHTGFNFLDKRLNGLRPGSLTVLAARPKIGKSMFLMNVAKQVAFYENKPVLYIDTENTEEEQASRLVSMLSGVPERKILAGDHLGNPTWAKNVEDAFTILQSGKLLFKYMPGFRVDTIKGLTRKHKIKDNIGLVIFDYIKLPDVGQLETANETQFMGQVATGMKDLAGELKIPALVACQLGRLAEGKSHVTSGMIGETDRILRYATAILALCRKTPDEIKSLGNNFGAYRLQVLNARGGGELYEGIDIDIFKPTLLVREAIQQSYDANRMANREDEHYNMMKD